MARIILVFLLSIAACVTAQSLCDKYTTPTTSGASLVQLLVNAVVASVTTNTTTAKYFDGSLAPYNDPSAVNFTDPGQSAALNHLVGNLDTYFFNALGCTDGSLGNYTGETMTDAHAALPIGPVQFDSFNQQIIAVLAGAGVQQSDQDAVLALLNSLKPQICNQPACSATPVPTLFCDVYSSALKLTEYDLIDTVVVGVITNVTTPGSPLKKFFDGTISGTTNFLADPVALARLRGHLNQFFGKMGVLNCSAANFPTYTGASLPASHAKLQIDVVSFNLFNQVVLGVMAGAGVSVADRATVLTILQSTQSQIVTVTTTGTTGTTGTPAATTGAGSGSGSGSGSGGATTGAKATTSGAYQVVVTFFVVVSTLLVLL